MGLNRLTQINVPVMDMDTRFSILYMVLLNHLRFLELAARFLRRESYGSRSVN